MGGGYRQRRVESAVLVGVVGNADEVLYQVLLTFLLDAN